MQLRQLHPILAQARRRISALYVAGNKANENYAVLTPYMEFSRTLKVEQELLRANVAKRRLDLDLDSVITKYELFRTKHLRKADLEAKRDAVANELKDLQKTSKDKSSVEDKKQEGIRLRNALKALKEELYPIEDDFIHIFLRLPNKLHRATPIDEPNLLYRQGLPKDHEAMATKINHLDRKDIIDYRDPTCFYLMKEAAHFDFYTPHSCVRRFLKLGYVQFVNPDFARTLLLEAATIDVDRIETVEEEDVKESKVNLLHLTGGGSMASFLGFVTKLTIFPSLLPLRFVASGREYSLLGENTPRGLYTAVQSTSVQLFIVVKDEAELEHEIEAALNETIDIFREFNTHFRIVYASACELTEAESLRASIQMFSPFYNDYIEVGHLSNYADYISKRLLFNYREEKSFKFPCIAAGSILNVTKILACLVENQRPLVVPFTNEKVNDEAIKKFKNLFS